MLHRPVEATRAKRTQRVWSGSHRQLQLVCHRARDLYWIVRQLNTDGHMPVLVGHKQLVLRTVSNDYIADAVHVDVATPFRDLKHGRIDN